MEIVGCVLILGAALEGAAAPALESDRVRVRVSVKLVLSEEGYLPTGLYRSQAEVREALEGSNETLARSGANWTLLLDEVEDCAAAHPFYRMASADIVRLEEAARADPEGYLWRSDAINIYLVDLLTDGGGVCSIPFSGPSREAIVINSQGIFGRSQGWLHEIGHYFALLHTHEEDGVADTAHDPPTPDPFSCQEHDRNFLEQAEETRLPAVDVHGVLENVMSYHCRPQFLTPLQVVRMRRSLLDERRHVRIPEPEEPPPSAVVQARGAVTARGEVYLGPEPVQVELDGSLSRDCHGGTDLTLSWALLEGPEGGAVFEGSREGWRLGYSGLGYGGRDDLTQLLDMRGRYVTVYATRAFEVQDPARLAGLEMEVSYDDGFAAYLNGVEVARENLPAAATPATLALRNVDGARVVIDLASSLPLLRAGANRLSLEVHNASLDSLDLSLHGVLRARDAAGTTVTLVPSRALWHYRKGFEGLPPEGWTEPEFDPRDSRVRVLLSLPGEYRFGLTADAGFEGARASAGFTLRAVEEATFMRGDCNRDGGLDISDGLELLFFLFRDGRELSCPDSCDFNDDERLELSDPVALFTHLFLRGAPPPGPYPARGFDPGGEELGCGD